LISAQHANDLEAGCILFSVYLTTRLRS
jgi:hypothetical protein